MHFLPQILLLVLITFVHNGNCRAPVTDTELGVISESLWTADVNNVANMVTINLQGRTTSRGRDVAPQPFLTVNSSVYLKSTIAKLIPLQDNYVAEAGSPEVVTSTETQEETQFLDAILATSVMQKVEKILTDKGYISTKNTTPRKAFREALQLIWFGLYTRENNTLGSSGFEHIFVGEIKNGQVSGVHNWLFFASQEAANHVNYNGYMTNIQLGSKGQIVKYNFRWNGTLKPVTSMFIGTSPEFEMGIYTLCFYIRPGQQCPILLNGKQINIQTHYLNRRGKRYVGSAYPDI